MKPDVYLFPPFLVKFSVFYGGGIPTTGNLEIHFIHLDCFQSDQEFCFWKVIRCKDLPRILKTTNRLNFAIFSIQFQNMRHIKKTPLIRSREHEIPENIIKLKFPPAGLRFPFRNERSVSET